VSEYPTPDFASELIAVAFICSLTRSDGVRMGLTSADHDIHLGDMVYRSDPGMMPSAIVMGGDLERESAGIETALASSLLTRADVEAGRWLNALVRVSALDWSRGDAEPILLARGTIGGITREVGKGNGFIALEFLSDCEKLGRSGVPRISPTCRSALGDARCGVDLSFREHLCRLQAAQERRIRLEQMPVASVDLVHGNVRFLDGPMSGLDRDIVAEEDGWLILDGGEVLPGMSSTRLRVREGCDRRFSTCAGRFQNSQNFDGEPHVPGDDMLLRYGDL